jgi:hypothetical protein
MPDTISQSIGGIGVSPVQAQAKRAVAQMGLWRCLFNFQDHFYVRQNN